MVLVQKWPFFQLLFFTKYRPGKCLLRYSRTKKLLFRLYNQEVQKVEEVDIYPKELSNGFGPKMAIFPSFFFRKCRLGKRLLRYSRAQKRRSRLKNQEVQKVEKLIFF